jgi:hypothetical protein
MVIRKSTTHAYYPVSGKGPDLIRGSGRIRYVHGFIVVNPKEFGPTKTRRAVTLLL